MFNERTFFYERTINGVNQFVNPPFVPLLVTKNGHFVIDGEQLFPVVTQVFCPTTGLVIEEEEKQRLWELKKLYLHLVICQKDMIILCNPNPTRFDGLLDLFLNFFSRISRKNQIVYSLAYVFGQACLDGIIKYMGHKCF